MIFLMWEDLLESLENWNFFLEVMDGVSAKFLLSLSLALRESLSLRLSSVFIKSF